MQISEEVAAAFVRFRESCSFMGGPDWPAFYDFIVKVHRSGSELSEVDFMTLSEDGLPGEDDAGGIGLDAENLYEVGLFYPRALELLEAYDRQT